MAMLGNLTMLPNPGCVCRLERSEPRYEHTGNIIGHTKAIMVTWIPKRFAVPGTAVEMIDATLGIHNQGTWYVLAVLEEILQRKAA